ncbi:PepSY domain-containing protein [Streptomyces halobius]|uniref:PepSY domain-containing protein n=1 Tax=Streptomyces halobius TaxID=2879846 RepID=A0ABY4LZE0_9ACTN|nr:PepSY domain-containing protein [Streptomyces halobius]UQA90592.1 PepSY domain-containing protein [Streptomyces halobius]
MSGCGDEEVEGPAAPSPASPGTEGATRSPTPPASPTPTGRLTEDQAGRKALVPSAKTVWDQAARAATAKVSGSKLVEIELDRSADGGPEWDTKVATTDGTAHDVRVDAVTGKVTHSRAEPDQDSDDKRELADQLRGAEISPQQAVTTATDREEGVVTAVGLEDSDGGATAWSVDVVTQDDWYKTTFDIDTANGKVLHQEVDRD